MDSAVMPYLRRQCRASSAPRARLQPGQFHADASHAEGSGDVVADQLARKADQNRREGRQSRPIRHVPARRGRGAETDVRRNPIADRPTAGTARASMTGAGVSGVGKSGEKYAFLQANRARFGSGALQWQVLIALRLRQRRFAVTKAGERCETGRETDGIRRIPVYIYHMLYNPRRQEHSFSDGRLFALTEYIL